MTKALLLTRFHPSEYLPSEAMDGYVVDGNNEVQGGYSMVGHVPNNTGLCIVWVNVSPAVATQIKNDTNFVVLGVVDKDADISAVPISSADQTRIKNYFISKGFDADKVKATDISTGWKFVKAAGKLLSVDPQEVRRLLEAQEE